MKHMGLGDKPGSGGRRRNHKENPGPPTTAMNKVPKKSPPGGVEPVVKAVALSKRFKEDLVIRGMDFEIGAGRCFGFLGPNGAGKTTILRMILGLSPMSAGSLHVFGLPLPARGREVRARVGVVPQEDNLDPDFTVSENLRMYARYFALPGAVTERRIRELLDFVQLADRAGARIPTLSGGMKRRLTIARALMNDPEMIILDEPTIGLDPQVRHMVWARLRELRQAGKTLLLTTHYMEEAERLCDEVVIMDHGSILEQGRPRALMRKHVEPEVLEIRAAKGVARKTLEGVPGCRMERVGDTMYCYTRDAEPAIERLKNTPALTYLHRPANLEDVFLQLTGRELRD